MRARCFFFFVVGTVTHTDMVKPEFVSSAVTNEAIKHVCLCIAMAI